MAAKTTYLIQAFVKRRGQLGPGAREAAPTPAGAMKRAEAWSSRYLGTAALAITADDDTGEVSDAQILSRHGEVPDDLLERIREG